MKDAKGKFKSKVIISLLILLAVVTMTFLVGLSSVFAQEQKTAAQKVELSNELKAEVLKFELIAAAIAFGFGAIAAGIAIANVGAAAMGAIGEKPEIAGQALIFVALAEGLAVFGLIIAIFILGTV